MKMKLPAILIYVALLSLFSGCLSFNPPKREKRPAFVVECVRPSDPPGGAQAATFVLRMKAFRAAEPYDTRRMMVLDGRTGRIAAMDKGEFAVPVAPAAADAARRWLASSRRFADVVDPSALPRGDVVTLDGWVDQACVVEGDEGFAFILKMSLWMIPDVSVEGATRRRFDYAESVPMARADPGDVAASFGKALGQVMTRFESDLEQRL